MAKRRKKAKKSSSKSRAELTKRALRLIDQAADLMKASVIVGAKQGAKGKAALKRKAYSFADIAVRQLHTAVRKGGKAIRKGIKKL
jgi:hypothetical protein